MKLALDAGFAAAFGGVPSRYFSAPGRTEIGGNHTDHQRGRVLAGAVNLDTVAAVRPNGTNTIRIQSKGYPLSIVQLDNLSPVAEEVNTTPALIRGVAARFTQLGCKVEGFDAYCESSVLPGSGLSSSAAYEVLIGTIINHLFFDGRVSQAEVAQIGQYAENVFFGKPCGLMDQTASAVGNLVTIDFFQKDHPVIEPVDFDFASSGHALCIIDSGADHADLTDEYAAIPGCPVRQGSADPDRRGGILRQSAPAAPNLRRPGCDALHPLLSGKCPGAPAGCRAERRQFR